MISIDTNVLLRYVLMDDKAQSPKAVKRITGKDKVLITDVVLVETTWTLKGKKYKQNKDEIVKVIISLFQEHNIIFEDGSTVWKALNDYRLAKRADFADALIINKSKYVVGHADDKLEGVYTFDVAAREIAGTKEP